MYRVKARKITSVTVSPWSAATLFAASQSSSGMRTDRVGVAGWFGTQRTLGGGVYTPGQRRWRSLPSASA